MGHTNKAQRDKYERNTITLISKYGIKMKIALRHVSYTNITIKPSYCFAMIILSKKKNEKKEKKKKFRPTLRGRWRAHVFNTYVRLNLKNNFIEFLMSVTLPILQPNIVLRCFMILRHNLLLPLMAFRTVDDRHWHIQWCSRCLNR